LASILLASILLASILGEVLQQQPTEALPLAIGLRAGFGLRTLDFWLRTLLQQATFLQEPLPLPLPRLAEA